MFERFTDQARRVVVLAQEEARLLNQDYIGTEHLLLGVIREGDSVAVMTLGRFGVTLEAARTEVERMVGYRAAEQSPGHIPFTPHAKRVLESAVRDGQRLGDRHVGPEHVLLGLLHAGEGVSVDVLDRLGLDRVETSQALLDATSASRVGDQTSRAQPRPVRIVGTPNAGGSVPGMGLRDDTPWWSAGVASSYRTWRPDPRFRIDVTAGDAPEYMAHECEDETHTS